MIAWETCAAVNDVGARAARWEELRNRLGEWHRDLDGDEIRHLPLDAFDLPVIEACQGSWRDSALVVGHVLAHRATDDGVLAAEVSERRPGWEGRVALLAGEVRARRLAREDVALMSDKRQVRRA